MVNPVSKEEITLSHLLAAEFIQKAFRRCREVQRSDGDIRASDDTQLALLDVGTDENRESADLNSYREERREAEEGGEDIPSVGGRRQHQALRATSSADRSTTTLQRDKYASGRACGVDLESARDQEKGGARSEGIGARDRGDRRQDKRRHTRQRDNPRRSANASGGGEESPPLLPASPPSVWTRMKPVDPLRRPSPRPSGEASSARSQDPHGGGTRDDEELVHVGSSDRSGESVSCVSVVSDPLATESRERIGVMPPTVNVGTDGVSGRGGGPVRPGSPGLEL